MSCQKISRNVNHTIKIDPKLSYNQNYKIIANVKQVTEKKI